MAQGWHGPCNTKDRVRSWFMTINNPSTEAQDYFKNISEVAEKDGIKKCSAQLEEGKNGTKHLQVAIYYKNPIRFNTLKNQFPEAHIEKVKNWNKAYNYCKKEETRIDGPWTYPEATKQDEKPNWGNWGQSELERMRVNALRELIQAETNLSDGEKEKILTLAVERNWTWLKTLEILNKLREAFRKNFY